MDFEQLSFLPPSEDNKNDNIDETAQNIGKYDVKIRSEKLLSEIDIMTFPFFGCDFDTVYRDILSVIPLEKIKFDMWDNGKLILAEIVCAGICHQINWDFLRESIYKRMVRNPEWIEPYSLSKVDEDNVFEMLKDYGKPERIRAAERAEIIRSIGKWASFFPSLELVFLAPNDGLLPENTIRNNLLKCSAFSKDPEEKKLQLLLQKLSAYSFLSQLSDYCNPAIDYHLVRMYFRRGLIYGRTKYAIEYLENPTSERKEETVASVRHLCADLMKAISDYTALSINSINQVDWHIGRSVCVQGKPDCNLQSNDSYWLKGKFSVCPYYNTCALRINHGDYTKMQEPNYKGDSF